MIVIAIVWLISFRMLYILVNRIRTDLFVDYNVLNSFYIKLKQYVCTLS